VRTKKSGNFSLFQIDVAQVIVATINGAQSDGAPVTGGFNVELNTWFFFEHYGFVHKAMAAMRTF
jgi:hypothetical protein